MSGANILRKGYHDLLRREILELIPTNAKKILDLGCGSGVLGKALKERQECFVTGIEINKGAVEIAKKNLDHVFCDNLNRFDPTFLKQKYDTLIFADILEHLIGPWRALEKFARVLTDDGVVIASVPNVAHPKILENLKKGVFTYAPAGILDITHLRFFTKTSIFQLFYTAGLKITNIRPHPSEENPIQYHVTAVKIPLGPKTPVATILILSYNGWEYTEKCLKSIKKNTHTPYKILVIDNGSTDRTVEELRKDRSIFHIENSCNLGFSKAFNLGMSLIDTPYFVIANNDIIVTENWLSTMIYYINEDPELMLLGPRSNYVSGPQIAIDASYKDDATLDEYAKIFKLFEEEPITYFRRIVFFCTLFKKEALEKIGFLDEIFGMGNFEDDDYCRRVQVKKLKTAYCNKVFIHHYGSTSFKRNPEEFKALLEKNKKIFMKKWGIKE